MKITRYYQSCLLIEEGDARILIDPSGQDKDIEKFGRVNAVFYTHEHGDHFDPGTAAKLAASGAAVYANASVAKRIDATKTEVSDGQEFVIKGIKIKAIELPHCPMPDGSDGPQNTGYLIGVNLFHPGDGKELAGLNVDNLALPISGPDISMRDACDFAKQTGAQKVIPIHYDMMSAKPDFFARISEIYNMPFKTHALENGQSVEL